MIVTVIGSRSTPAIVLTKMIEINKWLMKSGVVVRSGAAGGADSTVNTAYNESVEAGIPVKHPEVYIPWGGFGSEIRGHIHYSVQGYNMNARQIAQQMHPVWERCSHGAKALHTRNVCQILGSELQHPSDVVLYWCREKGGEPTGGTATAVRLAKHHNVKCVNMIHADWSKQLREALGIPL
ncbi:MAG: hypothetical protein Unbinned4336contig1000_14 [Prokaryotic dsDNA virus sp.]|nr:MAG: hypothetical protein Unbinned4336contig1000_14 [Prokaryotic dsDNA virus sp.]|tara:strand:- start:32579 stop:33121 length:543 start_codon:yes stop_codon:yes gene_type:complete